MSKLGIKELSSSLFDKHGLSKTDAEKFVSTIFDVINEGLASDKLVKVKGLGTFKIIGVSARKSVDVNTGAPIVIEGRDKISFTPDATLRDEINKPFSQFDTVVLNEGVDFSNIDKDFEEDPEAAVLKAIGEATVVETSEDQSLEDRNSETNPMEAASTQAEKSSNDISVPVSSVSANLSESPTVQEVEAEVPTDEEEHKDNEAMESVVPSTENTAVKNSTKESPAPTSSSVDKTSDVAENDKEVDAPAVAPVLAEKAKETEEPIVAKQDKEVEEKNKEVDNKSIDVQRALYDDDIVEEHQNKALKVLIAVAAVIIIGCIGGGYYLYKQIEKRDSHIELLEKQMKIVAQSQKKDVVAQSHQKAVSKPADTLKTSLATPAKKVEKGKEEKDNSTEEDALQAQYNKDPRIRTGAYIITGIERTVIANPGQTMSGISRSTLGLGMECYLEAVNGGQHELKAGDKVKIPKLKLKKKALQR